MPGDSANGHLHQLVDGILGVLRGRLLRTEQECVADPSGEFFIDALLGPCDSERTPFNDKVAGPPTDANDDAGLTRQLQQLLAIDRLDIAVAGRANGAARAIELRGKLVGFDVLLFLGA